MTNNLDQFIDDIDDFNKIDDHYSEHLAQLDESQDVLSSEDIYNDKGILLCKKGMHINKKTAEKLIQHKLTKPIEDSIKLSNSIDNEMLLKKLLGKLDTYQDCRIIHDKMDFDAINNKAFLFTHLHPIVIQKLTVINEQMPKQLDKAVFCAWLSLLIATEMGLDQNMQQEAFLAGLLHDIGFIHLSPELLSKHVALSAEEWRAVQSHVIVGKLMLEKYDSIPASVATAVFEHHERCDGSGYPVNKNDATLGVLGQIAGIADSIYSIRMTQFDKHGRTMYDLLPYLQMNATTYFYDVYKALTAILKRSGLNMSLPKNKDISQWSGNLMLRQQALNQAINSLTDSKVLELTSQLTGNKGQSMFKITQHVLKMTSESGLVGVDMHEWLQHLIKEPDPHALAELNEIELMLNELNWQLNYAYRACNDSLAQTKADASTQFSLREAYNSVSLCLGDLEDKI